MSQQLPYPVNPHQGSYQGDNTQNNQHQPTAPPLSPPGEKKYRKISRFVS